MSDDAAAGPGIEASLRGRLGQFRLEADFQVPASGVTALFGPSGSGKTTVLRCIAGLQRMAGRLSVRGQVWQDDSRFLPPHQRPVGFVFQEPSLLAHLSVRSNLEFGLKRARQVRLGFDEVCAFLGLKPLLGRGAMRLSGGERQRVALGRALLSQPELLVMDEPLSGLDGEAKSEILPYLERLPRTMAIPILYVSHDAAEVARLADRVLLIRAGRIEPAPVSAGVPASKAGEGDLAGLGSERLAGLALAALAAGLEPVKLSRRDR
ncbi:MAG TPA: molybdenum ABC transporter ATP-binding protein [Caulobacteraceae bacterium]